MSAASATFPTPAGTPAGYGVILRAGLVAGALDITAACVSSWLRAGVGPVRVLQSVASGVLGADSYNGGLGSAALGVPHGQPAREARERGGAGRANLIGRPRHFFRQ